MRQSEMVDRRLRIGVIGAGSWTVQSHLKILARRSSEVELWAVCRRNSEALEDIRRRYGFRYGFTDYEGLAQSGVDVCIVASPGSMHYRHARAALEGGAHTLVEKPFTSTAVEAWDLVSVAAGQGR